MLRDQAASRRQDGVDGSSFDDGRVDGVAGRGWRLPRLLVAEANRHHECTADDDRRLRSELSLTVQLGKPSLLTPLQLIGTRPRLDRDSSAAICRHRFAAEARLHGGPSR